VTKQHVSCLVYCHTSTNTD